MRPNVRLADRGQGRGAKEWELVWMTLPESDHRHSCLRLLFAAAALASGDRFGFLESSGPHGHRETMRMSGERGRCAGQRRERGR